MMSKHRNRTVPYGLFVILSLVLAFMTGCGSGGGSGGNDGNIAPAATSISGTAATGLPIDGFLYIVDASGVEINQAINSNGSFSIDTSGLTPPLALRAIPNAGFGTQYSFSNVLNGTANVTPFTTLAMFLATNRANLDNVYANWANSTSGVTPAVLDDAQQTIADTVSTFLQAAGVNRNGLDFFDTPFNANGSGMDAVYDRIRVAFNFATGEFTLSDALNGFAGVSFPLGVETGGNTGGDMGGGMGTGNGVNNWTITVTGANTTNGFSFDIPPTVLTGITDTDVPFNESQVNLDSILQQTGASSGATFSNVTSSLDTSGYSGAVGSQIILHLSGNMMASQSGFTFNGMFAYQYLYELISN